VLADFYFRFPEAPLHFGGRAGYLRHAGITTRSRRASGISPRLSLHPLLDLRDQVTHQDASSPHPGSTLHH
jgi:hypothetical protein